LLIDWRNVDGGAGLRWICDGGLVGGHVGGVGKVVRDDWHGRITVRGIIGNSENPDRDNVEKRDESSDHRGIVDSLLMD
jgi:hypothetical protein